MNQKQMKAMKMKEKDMKLMMIEEDEHSEYHLNIVKNDTKYIFLFVLFF